MNFTEALVAKAKKDYERNFSTLSEEDIELAAKLDTSSQFVDDDLQNIGFIAKQLIIPNFDREFISANFEQLASAVQQYKDGIANYRKPNSFKSLEEFLTYMQNPTPPDADIENSTAVDRLTKIYNRYYENSIPNRATFDEIVQLDPNSTDTKIGELAKNLLLRRYIAGDNDFLNAEVKPKLIAAIDRFNSPLINRYAQDKRNPMTYASIAEFINYQPESPIVDAIGQGQTTKFGFPAHNDVDYKLIASSSEYDVFRLITFRGSEALAHSNGMTNVWCTAGGSDGTDWSADPSVDPPIPSSQWRNYVDDHGYVLYEFISLVCHDRKDNYNAAFNPREKYITEFRDGDNQGLSQGQKEVHPIFQKFLTAHPDLIPALLNSNDPISEDITVVTIAASQQLISNQEFVIESLMDAVNFYRIADIVAGNPLAVVVDIADIPAGLFENQQLKSIKFSDKVESIGVNAFKNAILPADFELPKNIVKISSMAFLNASINTAQRSTSIKLPDSLTEIGQYAFRGMRNCKFKLNKFRTNRLKLAAADSEWAKTAIKAIDGEHA